jgi:hypothetical protein
MILILVILLLSGSAVHGFYTVHRNFDRERRRHADVTAYLDRCVRQAGLQKRGLVMAELFDDPPETRSRIFTAAFYSSCADCGQFISEGDTIAMTDVGAICEECADEPGY